MQARKSKFLFYNMPALLRAIGLVAVGTMRLPLTAVPKTYMA
jgi:hypothetical protein